MQAASVGPESSARRQVHRAKMLQTGSADPSSLMICFERIRMPERLASCVDEVPAYVDVNHLRLRLVCSCAERQMHQAECESRQPGDDVDSVLD